MFTVNDPCFPSPDWALSVFLANASVRVSGVPDENGGFIVGITPEQTAGLSGMYQMFYRFTSGDEVHTRKSCVFTVKPNPSTAQEKSFAKKTLEAVEAAILKLASGTNETVNINGQQFTKKDINELWTLRTNVLADVIREDRAALGIGQGYNIQGRFVTP